MPPGWLPLLCVALLIWRPLNFAIELPATLPSLPVRGPLALIEMIFHATIAVLAVAAARAIWGHMASALAMARLALLGSAAASIQSLNWSVLPSQTAPGEPVPYSILAALHAGLWLFYLQRFSRRHPDWR